MINGDINKLFAIDVSNYELGIVKDRYGHFFINPNYFNSGMLLMNMKKIKESNLLEKERKIDLIRWSIASELSLFDYFDLNAVMCYLVKVCIVARWSVLDRATGRAMFERLMAELDGKELVGKL